MSALRQFTTFYVDDRLYGIEVTEVQEVALPMPTTPIHLAPPSVVGLTNLRGQIATAIGLRELFGLSPDQGSERMAVVCKCEGDLLSLQVDRIGDVIEVSTENHEPVPLTVDANLRQFIQGIYKTPDALLSVIELSKINRFLSK